MMSSIVPNWEKIAWSDRFNSDTVLSINIDTQEVDVLLTILFNLLIQIVDINCVVRFNVSHDLSEYFVKMFVGGFSIKTHPGTVTSVFLSSFNHLVMKVIVKSK